MISKSIVAPLLSCIALSLIVAPACAADSPDIMLARNPETTLTRADWEADLQRIPADKRDAFAAGPQRVQAVINNLLVSKTLAARARAKGLDRDPLTQRRIALETDRLLTMVYLEKVEDEARAEFDRHAERNAARARELYLAGGGKYTMPEEVNVSHILFAVDKRGKDAALAAAQAARAKLAAGADFATLAKETSDDPTAKTNGGDISWFKRGVMDPAFEKAAFALRNPGELSEPVLSSFGYHVIRFEGRRPARPIPFDEIKVKIIDEMRAKAMTDAREAVLASIKSDPKLEINQAAIEALVVKIEIPASDLAVPPQVPRSGLAPAPQAGVAPTPK